MMILNQIILPNKSLETFPQTFPNCANVPNLFYFTKKVLSLSNSLNYIDTSSIYYEKSNY